MGEKSIKQTINGELEFNHLDPYFARLKVNQSPVKAGVSELYGVGSINITADMFPEDFELYKYDVSGSVKLVVEITPK